MGTRRLFIAVPVPPAVASLRIPSTEMSVSAPPPTISDLIATLNSFGPSLRTASVEHLHLTLKFLGDVADELRPEILQIMSRIAECEAQFSIHFRGLGTFPNLSQPTVVWAGVRGVEPLVRIAETLSQSLAPLGFKPEPRRYRPHLTLARVKQRLADDRLKSLVARLTEVEFARCEVTEFTLMESQRTSSGPVYNILESAALSRPDDGH